MKNIMKQYLGDAYTGNHIINFLNYWIKGQQTAVLFDCENPEPYYEWRRHNDLDCIAKGGDLRADTLVSAWTPMKQVLQILHPKLNVYKTVKGEDPSRDLKMLRDHYADYFAFEGITRFEKSMVRLLDVALSLAEEECNYILLPGPSRDTGTRMNPERYSMIRNGKKICLYDEIPCLLENVFDPETLGKYFDSEEAVVHWIRREHLEVGFYRLRGNRLYSFIHPELITDEDIRQDFVIPLTDDCSNPLSLTGIGHWITDGNDMKAALVYMIKFLSARAEMMEEV